MPAADRNPCDLPTCREDVIAGATAFAKHAPRAAMYNIATFVVRHFCNAAKTADGLGVLLLTWN
jgi:hypothetical protein